MGRPNFAAHPLTRAQVAPFGRTYNPAALFDLNARPCQTLADSWRRHDRRHLSAVRVFFQASFFRAFLGASANGRTDIQK